MAPLTACTALRDLRFKANWFLPDCLPQLTQLERLAACVQLIEDVAIVRAALRALTCITFLALSCHVDGLLPDIGAAQHVESLGLLMSREAVGAPHGAPSWPLAGLPALAGLDLEPPGG